MRTKYKEIKGDLVELGKKHEFDVICQGVNCQNLQKSGLAPQMVKAFHTDQFPMESLMFQGDINKLGQIDWAHLQDDGKDLKIVNCYTQFEPWSTSNPYPFDYEALKLCLRKINHKFKGQKIGLPKIGCGLARGSWDIVKEIIIDELYNCDITVVIFDKNSS